MDIPLRVVFLFFLLSAVRAEFDMEIDENTRQFLLGRPAPKDLLKLLANGPIRTNDYENEFEENHSQLILGSDEELLNKERQNLSTETLNSFSPVPVERNVNTKAEKWAVAQRIKDAYDTITSSGKEENEECTANDNSFLMDVYGVAERAAKGVATIKDVFDTSYITAELALKAMEDIAGNLERGMQRTNLTKMCKIRKRLWCNDKKRCETCNQEEGVCVYIIRIANMNPSVPAVQTEASGSFAVEGNKPDSGSPTQSGGIRIRKSPGETLLAVLLVPLSSVSRLRL